MVLVMALICFALTASTFGSFRVELGTCRPVFFVASRGHHADIGGITPGSMPPHSKSLSEV